MDIEFRKMLGRREMDSDGFTYNYGAHKGGYAKHPRQTNHNRRMRRNDKRAAKAAAYRREVSEQMEAVL